MRQDGVMQQPRNFSLYGAVDLGARQEAAQRHQASVAASQGAPRSEYVFDVTEAAFEEDVLERSRALPEAQGRQWLGQVLQVAQQLGLPSAGGEAGAGLEDGEGPAADGYREPE